jgi:hypothetical protein
MTERESTMTERVRGDLRHAIEDLVRVAMSPVQKRVVRDCQVGSPTYSVSVTLEEDYNAITRPLTPAQQLGLSVLVEDESTLPQALADFLLDIDQEYASAIARRVRTEERRAIALKLRKLNRFSPDVAIAIVGGEYHPKMCKGQEWTGDWEERVANLTPEEAGGRFVDDRWVPNPVEPTPETR